MSLQKKLNKSEALALMSYGAMLVHESGVYHHYYLLFNGEIIDLNKHTIKALLYNETRIVCTKREGFKSYYELKTNRNNFK